VLQHGLPGSFLKIKMARVRTIHGCKGKRQTNMTHSGIAKIQKFCR
jgi:hypothetical protein